MSMIDKDAWMDLLSAKLQERFAERLRFLGLQGSYRRGEATETSDFDAVVILDRVELADLKAYREIVAAMPDPAKACGFIGGAEEIRNWPRHELFQFVMDTEPHFGSLADLTPELGEEDAREAARVGAGGIYHQACHAYLYAGGDRGEVLRQLCKGAFFAMQAAHYLVSGEYAGSRAELREKLSGDERAILSFAADRAGTSPADDGETEKMFGLLLEWSGSLLRRL